MPLDWSPLVDFLRAHERPLLMSHVGPDADALGSQLALRDALLAIGKKPRVAISSKLLPRYEFLDPGRQVIEDFKPADFADRDCAVVLDTGTWNQLADFGKWLKASPLPRAVVDHHRTQDDLGGLQLVDVSAEATGRLVYEIIGALGAPMSADAAHYLFMAIATDTGWFRHPNATPPTFALCGELVAAGARPTEIYERLYEAAPLSRFKLTAAALQRLTLVGGGKIGYTEILLADYTATGAIPGDTGDLIDYPRSVEGVEIALLFTEQVDGGTKISFRARSADVSKLAEQFGGGGHRLASGAKVMKPLPEVRAAVLAAAEQLLSAPTSSTTS
jgi:phosphoesterase RecJ-like protein